MAKKFNISADSVPVYDTWGWDDYWSAQDWMYWHRLMKAKYGLDEANYRFIEAYHEAELFASSWDWNTFDFAFVNYAKANGFYDALFSGLSGLVQKTIGAGTGAVNDATEVVDNVFGGLNNLSKGVKVLLSVAVVIAVVLGYQYLKHGKVNIQSIIN